jgi:hypothetical protein
MFSRIMVSALVCISGCTSTSVTPLSRDVVQISTSAAPACGRASAKRVALQAAAIETLRQGYDGFVVFGTDYQDDVRVVGTTPVYGQSTYNMYGNTIYGNSSYSGGQPIMGGSRTQELTVKMFPRTDPNFISSVDARSVLGSDWQALVEDGAPNTCT